MFDVHWERGHAQAQPSETEAARAQALEDAERHIAHAELAIKGLLERVQGLQLAVEETQRVVEQAGAELARRLEQSAEPLVSGLRARAEALEAEVGLMSAGFAAARETVTAQTAEDAAPAVEAAAAPAGEASPAAAGGAPAPAAVEAPAAPAARAVPVSAGEPSAEPGTGLTPGDVEAAADQLSSDPAVAAPPAANDAATAPPEPAPDAGTDAASGIERARLAALNMALGGTPREQAERQLREELDIEDPAEILAEAYGPPEQR